MGHDSFALLLHQINSGGDIICHLAITFTASNKQE